MKMMLINQSTPLLPDGKRYPKSWVAIVKRIPKCLCCGRGFDDGEIVWFCKEQRKWYCFNCLFSLQCKDKHIVEKYPHVDRLTKIVKDKVEK